MPWKECLHDDSFHESGSIWVVESKMDWQTACKRTMQWEIRKPRNEEWSGRNASPGSTAAIVEAQLSVVEMMLSSSLLPALKKGHRYLARGSRFLCKPLTAIWTMPWRTEAWNGLILRFECLPLCRFTVFLLFKMTSWVNRLIKNTFSRRRKLWFVLVRIPTKI